MEERQYWTESEFHLTARAYLESATIVGANAWLRYIAIVNLTLLSRKKGKVLRYLLPSVGPGADPGVQAVSPQVSHPPGGRLPLLTARPAVIFPAAKHHRPLAGTELYCLVTEAHACEQLAQGCYLEAEPRFEPATFRIASKRSTVKPHRPLYCHVGHYK